MIYEACKSRQVFLSYLSQPHGLIVICLSAPWCKPCRQISNVVDEHFMLFSSEGVECAKLNIDHYSDLYSFLRSKKMVSGVPTILCYKQNNVSYIPDDSVSGGDLLRINLFFQHIHELSDKISKLEKEQ